MTIMGILILITLMMSLELTQAVSAQPQTPTDTTSPVNIEPLEHELSQLQQEYQQFQKQLIRLTQINLTSPTDLKEQKDNLVRRYEQFERLQQQITQMKKMLPAKIAIVERTKAIQAQTAILVVQAKVLRARIQNMRQNPHLSYILQAGQTGQPIICVLSAKQIGLGEINASGPVLWLNDTDIDRQLELLKQFLKNCHSDRQYVVILLKPSAFNERYATVRNAIEKAGFKVGLDMIGEADQVLAGGR